MNYFFRLSLARSTVTGRKMVSAGFVQCLVRKKFELVARLGSFLIILYFNRRCKCFFKQHWPARQLHFAVRFRCTSRIIQQHSATYYKVFRENCPVRDGMTSRDRYDTSPPPSTRILRNRIFPVPVLRLRRVMRI
jgi:hypothetical protein